MQLAMLAITAGLLTGACAMLLVCVLLNALRKAALRARPPAPSASPPSSPPGSPDSSEPATPQGLWAAARARAAAGSEGEATNLSLPASQAVLADFCAPEAPAEAPPRRSLLGVGAAPQQQQQPSGQSRPLTALFVLSEGRCQSPV